LKPLLYRLLIGLGGLALFWAFGMLSAKEYGKSAALMATALPGLTGLCLMLRTRPAWLSATTLGIVAVFFLDAATKGFLRDYFGLRQHEPFGSQRVLPPPLARPRRGKRGLRRADVGGRRARAPPVAGGGRERSTANAAPQPNRRDQPAPGLFRAASESDDGQGKPAALLADPLSRLPATTRACRHASTRTRPQHGPAQRLARAVSGARAQDRCVGDRREPEPQQHVALRLCAQHHADARRIAARTHRLP